MQNSATQRVIALVDMDCFYCQVEARLNPSLKGKAVAVVQYNQWKGGGIIAVNYEARAQGVIRGMRGDEAKEKCPDIILASVPSIRGKADLTNYRNAGDEVAKVFSEFSDCVQRASIDEAYLDLTKAVQDCINSHNKDITVDNLPSTFVLGYCDTKTKSEDERKKGLHEWLKLVESQKTSDLPDYRLAVGGMIVEKMREEILKRTGFHCSAGIAHNKILAKLTAGLHKPKKQTILPQDSIPELYETVPIYKVRNLGGKLGKLVSEKLNIKYMSELYKFSLHELQQKFDEKTSLWLHNIARGIDLDPVTSRLKPESIGCCKNFAGKNMLTTKTEVEHWLKELASEISERLTKDLERNKRRAKLLTVSFYQESAMTRCTALNSYEIPRIVGDALDLLKKHNNASPNEDAWNPPIKYLGLSASKFTEELSSIEKYFKFSKGINNDKSKSTENALENSKESSIKKSSEELVGLEKYIKKKPENVGLGFSPNKCAKEDAFVSKQREPVLIDKFLKKLEKTRTEKTLVNKDVENEVSSEDLQKLKESGDAFSKEVSKATSHLHNSQEPGPSRETKTSFFLEFLSKKREEIVPVEEQEVKQQPSKDQEIELKPSEQQEDAEQWISLSEVFPDIKEAELELVEILPDAMQKKFKERLNSYQEEEPVVEIIEVAMEKCAECGKDIPKNEVLEHSDYHAALKLYSKINKITAVNGGVLVKSKAKEPESTTKRKKKTAVTPSKKMRSITSFFNVVSK